MRRGEYFGWTSKVSLAVCLHFLFPEGSVRVSGYMNQGFKEGVGLLEQR